MLNQLKDNLRQNSAYQHMKSKDFIVFQISMKKNQKIDFICVEKISKFYAEKFTNG